MSSLSFENIDRWLFEYMEGNLSTSQIEQLENFIFLHPELNVDLEAWKSSKVVSNPTSFNASEFTKPNPTPLVLWSSIGVLSIILFTFQFVNPDFFQVKSKYAQQNIDLTLISEESTGNVFEDIDNDAQLAFHTNIDENFNNKARSKDVTSTKTNNEVGKYRNSNTLNEYNFETSEKSKNSINNNSDAQKVFRKENEEIAINDETESKSNKSLAKNQVLATYSNSHNYTSPNLEEVVASLSPSQDEPSLQEGEKQLKRRFSTGNQSSKGQSSSFQKGMKKFSRKVRKMADQPVALRNSKDPNFHAPFMTGFNSNFGMAGTLMRNRFQSTSRAQFLGEDNQQLMNQISWDNYIYALRGGLGVDVNYIDYGDGSIENFEVAVTYSPKLSLTKNISLEPAVRFKTGVVNLDTESSIIGRDIEIQRNNLRGVFTDGEDPIGSQLWYRDIGTSLLLNTKWFYAGVNVDNVNRHYNNFHSADVNADHRAMRHITSIIGTEYKPFGKNVTYSGYVLHQMLGDLNEIWFGGNVQWNWLKIGGGISNNSEYGGSIGVDFGKFSLNYNIDYLDSRLLSQQILSHQVSMRYMIKPNKFASKLLTK